jgi:endonuclease-3
MKPQARAKLLAILETLYPEPRSELDFSNEYELLISVVLSAQCTDKKVNQVTPELFKRYPTFKKLASARVEDVATIIRPINYYKTKSTNIVATAQRITEEYRGTVPKTHEELTSLPGVGRKTANVVLGETGAVPSLPVDTHVFRVSNRLGLSSGKTTEAVERDLCAIFHPSEWRNLHHRLIFHGRRVCKARNPDCALCELRKICPSKASDAT